MLVSAGQFALCVIISIPKIPISMSGFVAFLGTVTEIAVSVSTTTIEDDAIVFNPTDRKCWLQEEIELEHLPLKEENRL